MPLKGFEDAPAHPLRAAGDIPSAQVSARRRCRDRARKAGCCSPTAPSRRSRSWRTACASRPRRQHHRRLARCSPPIRRSTTASRCTARWRPIAPMRWPSPCRAARCPMRSTGTWPIPTTTCASIPGPGTTDYLIVGGADHKSGEADDGDVRFEAIEAWIRSLVPQARQGGASLVGPSARHHRLLRLHRPQPWQRECVRRDRRFRPGHDPRRARRHAAEGTDADRQEPLGSGLRSGAQAAHRRS